jgi:hypothetical protein
MSPSLASKARGRAIDVAGAIREALSELQSRRALDRAIGALNREMKGVRNWRAGDAMLLEADLAGVIAAKAALLATRVPYRRPGCPAIPLPDDVTAAFEAAYERTINEDLNGGDQS